MAPRAKTNRRSITRRRVTSKKARTPAVSASNPRASWSHIEWLIDSGGAISVSTDTPIGCIASAADRDICYAMLLRREGERIQELLSRLDQAIASASETGELVDEINP